MIEESSHPLPSSWGLSIEPPPYNLDQRVLCKDLTRSNGVAGTTAEASTPYYEAIVKKVRCIEQGQWSFWIHYLGWNTRWDRWVAAEDLLPGTPDNINQYIKPSATGTSGSSATATSANKKRKKEPAQPNSKRKKNSEVNSMLTVYQDYCKLPLTLKTILVEECERLTRQGADAVHGFDCDGHARPARAVHNLPATVTVKNVMQHYQRKRGGTDQDEDKQHQVRIFCDGILKLFGDALPICLLYQQERPQYEAVLRDEKLRDKELSEIYGCEYLLRLIVRLPVLLQAEPKRDSSLLMGPLIADLIVLLQKNRQACFKSNYREPRHEELLVWEQTLARGR